MKASDIREKTDAELGELDQSLRDELFRLRMQLYTGQLDRPNHLRAIRKDVARVQTVMRERKA